MNYKSFYRLGGNPDQRLILRKLAEQYGSGMIHDHKTETTIITSQSQEADRNIYLRFNKIVFHGRLKEAMAQASFPDLNTKSIRTGFWQIYSDMIIARLDGKTIRISDGTSRLTRFAMKSAIGCDIK